MHVKAFEATATIMDLGKLVGLAVKFAKQT